jgi:hypothetical protein
MSLGGKITRLHPRQIRASLITQSSTRRAFLLKHEIPSASSAIFRESSALTGEAAIKMSFVPVLIWRISGR